MGPGGWNGESELDEIPIWPGGYNYSKNLLLIRCRLHRR